MDNGDAVFISVADSGVSVRSSRFGFLGCRLYRARTLEEAAATAGRLDQICNGHLTPPGMDDPLLKTFTKAVLQCSSVAEVADLLERLRVSRGVEENRLLLREAHARIRSSGAAEELARRSAFAGSVFFFVVVFCVAMSGLLQVGCGWPGRRSARFRKHTGAMSSPGKRVTVPGTMPIPATPGLSSLFSPRSCFSRRSAKMV